LAVAHPVVEATEMAWIWRALKREAPQRDTLRLDAALGYDSALSLREQRDRLNAAGPYEWVDRDSEWYPDYISTRVYDDYGFFKIFDAVDGRFNLTVKLVTDRAIVKSELARLLEVARHQVLPKVDAQDIGSAEPYD
jgi:hypothetical protein